MRFFRGQLEQFTKTFRHQARPFLSQVKSMNKKAMDRFEGYNRLYNWGRWDKIIWLADTSFKSIFLGLGLKLAASTYIESAEKEFNRSYDNFTRINLSMSELVLSYGEELYVPHCRALLSQSSDAASEVSKLNGIYYRFNSYKDRIHLLRTNVESELKTCNEKMFMTKFLFDDVIDKLHTLQDSLINLEKILDIILAMVNSLIAHHRCSYKKSYNFLKTEEIFVGKQIKLEPSEFAIDVKKMVESAGSSVSFRRVLINFFNLKGIVARVIATRKDEGTPDKPNVSYLLEAKKNFEMALILSNKLKVDSDAMRLHVSIIHSNMGFLLHDLARVKETNAKQNVMNQFKFPPRETNYEAYLSHMKAYAKRPDDKTNSAIMNGVADALFLTDIKDLKKKPPRSFKLTNCDPTTSNPKYKACLDAEILKIYRGIEKGHSKYGGPGFFTPVMYLNRANFLIKRNEEGDIDAALRDLDAPAVHERRDVLLLKARAYSLRDAPGDREKGIEMLDKYDHFEDPDVPNTYSSDEKSKELRELLNIKYRSVYTKISNYC